MKINQLALCTKIENNESPKIEENYLYLCLFHYYFTLNLEHLNFNSSENYQSLQHKKHTTNTWWQGNPKTQLDSKFIKKKKIE